MGKPAKDICCRRHTPLPRHPQSIRHDVIQELAQRIAMVDSGDAGTWGGNVCPGIYEVQENLSENEKVVFVELYLTEVRKHIYKFLF